MSNQNKEIMTRWFQEVWNEGRSEVIDELFSEDSIAHGLTDSQGNLLRGPAGFKIFFENFRGSFPDVKIKIEDMLAEGDKVITQCRVYGTHTGDTLGFPATHVPTEFEGVNVARIRNGQIAEGWNYFDFIGLYQQLGAITIKGM